MTDLPGFEEAPIKEPSPNKPSRWLAGAMGAVLLVSGVGVGYLVTSEGPTTTVVETSTSTTAPPALDVEFDEEPVADAAEVILPSVVQIETGGGLGSGVIYDSDGLILTAAHVVEGTEQVTVRLSDGERLTGTVVGASADADVAVIQVDRTDLPAATLALDARPRVGQMAIAVGSPWGLTSTVTAGIVSAVDQTVLGGSVPRSLLQTDAAINPGNSGGALVDRQGRVIGINVSIFSESGANDGVGFAVPIAVAHDIATRLVSGDTIEIAFLGVEGDDAVSGQAGALITSVLPGSAAEAAGLEVGDLIVAVDDVGVPGFLEMAARIRAYQPGDTVVMEVIRGGETLSISALLGIRPATDS